MTNIKIKSIRVISFKPKESLAELEINFDKDNSKEVLLKTYELKAPQELLAKMLIDIKSKDKILFEDPALNPVEHLERYSPILIKDGEKVEERLFNFIRDLCIKARQIRITRDAYDHMKLYDQLKTAYLSLE